MLGTDELDPVIISQTLERAQKTEADFYKYIVGLTKTTTPKSYRDLLERDGNVICELILKNYKENIELAAMNGRNIAYLCVYVKNARYRNTIPIHDFIDMPEKIKGKFLEFEFMPIIDRIKNVVFPFTIKVRSLQKCEEIQEIKEIKDFDKNDIYKNTADIIVISASWESANIKES